MAQRTLKALVALIAATASFFPARAGGFYLQEQSSRGAGRAFSGEVADKGASSLWWNPAASGGIAGTDIAFGFSAILPRGNVRNAGTLIVRPGQAPAPVGGAEQVSRNPIREGYLPAGAIAYRLSRQLSLGLTLTSPYSFTTSYGPTSWVRYTAGETRLRTYDIQPSIAIAPVDSVRLGVALNVERANATLSNALPNLSPLLADGQQTLRGKGWDVGFTAGGQVDAGPLMLGLSYKSSIRHTLKGTVAISGLLGPLAGQNANFPTSAAFRTPWQIDFGARWKVNQALTLDAQVNRFGWSRFDSIRLGTPINAALPEHYRDTWSIAGGFDYDVTPGWTLRGGIQRDQTPTRNGARDARVPDGNRWNFAAGTSYTHARITVDIAASYLAVANASIDRPTAAYADTSAQTPILVNGQLDNAHVVVATAGVRLAL